MPHSSSDLRKHFSAQFVISCINTACYEICFIPGTNIADYWCMGSTFEEQRKYKRYAQPDDAVAVCNTKIGRVISISEGGMAVNWLGDTSFPDEGTVTILSNSKDILINDLPVRFLSARNEQSSNKAIKMKRTVVSFNFANTKQHRQIKEYIAGLDRDYRWSAANVGK